MLRPGLLALALLGLGCRSGKGEQCVCAADCKSGLVCAIEGAVLDAGECTPDGVAKAGTCVPADDLPDDSGGLETTGPYLDMGSKKDFTPDPSTTATTSTDTSTGTEGTTTSTSSATSATSSGTGATSSTSSGSGDTSTGSGGSAT